MTDSGHAPTHCIRCGAAIDATDSVALSDGAACLSCVDKAAQAGALVLAKQQHVRHAAGWSGLAVLAFGGTRLLTEAPWPTVLGATGAVALVLAAVSFWRASRVRAPS